MLKKRTGAHTNVQSKKINKRILIHHGILDHIPENVVSVITQSVWYVTSFVHMRTCTVEILQYFEYES